MIVSESFICMPPSVCPRQTRGSDWLLSSISHVFGWGRNPWRVSLSLDCGFRPFPGRPSCRSGEDRGRIVGRIGGERNGCREVCNVDIQTCVDDDCLSELPPKPEPRTKFP